MGFAERGAAMESRTGSVSSGMGSSCDVRGQTLKSSPFCPRFSSKIAQSIIKDHMVSHYKKVYSAKAAIDASVPKSLLYSVKYNDQIRQERLRKAGRPQSAHSLSQRNSRASCSSTQSRSSVQYDERPYLCSRSSMTSSPRFSTSFAAKDAVYQSGKTGARPGRPASEITYRSPGAALQRRQSACSLGALGDQSPFKTFQDPVQKTYSGDLLQKHSQRFTQDKPFTPRTLRSDKSSYLSKYRYYRAPPRKNAQDCSRLTRQETYHGSTKNKDSTQNYEEPSQEFSTDHEWSEDDFNDTYLSSYEQQAGAVRTRERPLYASSPRFSAEGRKSLRARGVSAEEEELRYLEFISAVTDDILARGHISDRVIDRVVQRHIDMNLHKLDEGKMRHLVDVLRKDFEEPARSPSSSEQLEAKQSRQLESLLSHLEPHVKTKEDTDPSPYPSLTRRSTPSDRGDPLMASTPVFSPGRRSPTEELDRGDEGTGTGSSSLSDRVHDDDVDDRTDAVNGVAAETSVRDDASADGDVRAEGRSEEVDDLGRSLFESLHVSSSAHYEKEEAVIARTNAAAAASDDEF